jgi:hypothetical protein
LNSSRNNQCLVWYSFLNYTHHLGMYDEDFSSFDTNTIWVLHYFVLSNPVASKYHTRTQKSP